MSNILEMSAQTLLGAGFVVDRQTSDGRECLVFENSIVVGFLFEYQSPADLVASWSEDSNRMIQKYQMNLRRAGQKAWNTYVVLLSESSGQSEIATSLGAIEEDLVGTRKIARADVTNTDDVRAALLPLLPLQSAPKLDAVDMVSELRQRTTEISSAVVEAFLSKVDDSLVQQVMEQG